MLLFFSLKKKYFRHFLSSFLSSFSCFLLNNFLYLFLTVLPCMMILLSSEFEAVRKIAFDLLTIAAESGSELPHDESTLLWFTRNLLRFREEVVKDNAFLSQVLFIFLLSYFYSNTCNLSQCLKLY